MILTFLSKGKICKKIKNIQIKSCHWLETTELSFNIKKNMYNSLYQYSQCKKNRHNDIYIDGIEIDTVNHMQFVGVIIYNKIN